MSKPDNIPDEDTGKRRRLRILPLRIMLPSIITVLAICAGLTSIRMGIEGRYEFAVLLIAIAVMLDALDGRIARLLKSTSRFGAELDSLADFVNFGVAPALLIYFTKLHSLGNIGWVVALLFAIAAVLRLARFNVALDEANKPEWQKNFFTGVPAPAGAVGVLLPLYLDHLEFLSVQPTVIMVAAYTLLVGYFMISRIPVWSGKQVSGIITPANFLVIIVVILGLIMLTISFPYIMLSLLVICYLLLMPFWALSWYRQNSREKEHKHSNP